VDTRPWGRWTGLAAALFCSVTVGACKAPQAPTGHSLAADPNRGTVDRPVTFTARAHTGGGDTASGAFDLDGDGVFGQFEPFPAESDAQAQTSRSYSQPQTITVSHAVRVSERVQVFGGFLSSPASVARTTLTILPSPEAEAPTNRPPTASFTATPNPRRPEQAVALDASASSDSDGTIESFEWDIDGNGTFELNTGSNPRATARYDDESDHVVRLRVTDNRSASSETSRTIFFQQAGRVSERRIELRLASSSSEFILTPKGHELSPGTLVLNGEELTTLRASAKGKLPADEFPAELQRGPRRVRWSVAVDIFQDLETDERTFRGFALLAFPGGGRSCIAFEDASAELDGAFRVLGGTGKAARFAGRGIAIARADASLAAEGTLHMKRAAPDQRFDLRASGCAPLLAITKPF
jgi:hypothetical protein